MQQEAGRRPGVPGDLRREQPTTCTPRPRVTPRVTARTPRPRRPATSWTTCRHARPAARPDQRHRPGCADRRVPRVRPRGLLRLRHDRGGRAGHPRRRRRHQLLDQRRHPADERPHRAGVPRRVRRGRVRRDVRRQRRSRCVDRQPPEPVGDERRRVDADPRVRLPPHPHRGQRRHLRRRRLHHHRRRRAAAGRRGRRRAVQRRALRQPRPRRDCSPASSWCASAAMASAAWPRASTSSKAVLPG